MIRSTLLCVLSTALTPAAAERAIVIGGGYDIYGSQGQIELNTQWVQRILLDRKIDVSTFYTDGNAPADDVHYLEPWADYSSHVEPLTRIFSDIDADRLRYRNHVLDKVTDSTQRDVLEPYLSTLLENDPDKSTLLVYNGHGGQSYDTPDQVTLKLWGNTSLEAHELHALLGERQSPFRFIMTQCYSGGFHRLAYAKPREGKSLAPGAARCGFTAESAYRLSEGCSSSIDTADYRDYTTFFFAALTGVDRHGQELSQHADRDNDGQVTLREAHLYTLQEAISTDLPRSTSEDYLTTWQPWYLRWLPVAATLPENEYSKLFADVARRHGLDPEQNGIVRQIRKELEQQFQTGQSLAGQFETLIDDIEMAQYAMQTTLINRWPALAQPYTMAYEALASSGALPGISAKAAAMPEYAHLVDLQQQTEPLLQSILESERQVTQLEKLMRLRRLSSLQAQLYEYGSGQELRDYESLVGCENSALW